MKDNSSVYQSTSNEATLDKDNPVPQMNNMDVNSEELVRSFVGEKFKNFQKPFNVFALLFGGCYIFYRKMFLYGILTFILGLIILNFIKIRFVYLLFRVALGFMFNKIYLDFAKRKVRKIKYIKSQESLEDIKAICATKGGTSTLQVVLGVLVDFVITLIISLLLVVFVGVSFISSIFKDGNYSRIDTSINIRDYFAIGVPSVFLDESTDYEMKYTYSKDTGIMDSCSIKLYAVKNAESPQKALNKLTNSRKKDYTIKNINDLEWLYASEDAVNKIYYYAVEKDNKVFVLEFEIEPNADSSCNSYHDSIMTMVVSK